jgi:phosphatidyl-myo-inositol alpha-mannosyltransferase
MKIAMLSFRLPVPGVKRGGVERVAHDLADGLSGRGHEVTMWSADPAPVDANYRVRPLPFDSLIHDGVGFRLVSGFLGNLIALLPRYQSPDVLIAHGDSLFLPLRGIPLLRIMHGSGLDEARTAKSLKRRIAQYLVYLQERITTRTQYTVAISRSTCLRYSGIQKTIPNGVDQKVFFPCNSAKTNEPTILFVGTLGGRKRGTQLMDWFRDSILPAVPNARLWMVSEPGPPRERVEYFSGLSSAALADLYRRAWIFASPSVYEGFGLPYLEAMASGTPVIATKNAGSSEVLDNGRYGVLIDNDTEFPAAILRALADSEQRATWTQRGLERASELSLTQMVDRYETLLLSMSRNAALSEVHA